jgi:hypothetical protein
VESVGVVPKGRERQLYIPTATVVATPHIARDVLRRAVRVGPRRHGLLRRAESVGDGSV